MTIKKEEVLIMDKANTLLCQNKIAYDSKEKKLIWLYYPKVFQKLMKRTVPSK